MKAKGGIQTQKPGASSKKGIGEASSSINFHLPPCPLVIAQPVTTTNRPAARNRLFGRSITLFTRSDCSFRVNKRKNGTRLIREAVQANAVKLHDTSARDRDRSYVMFCA